MNLDRNEMAEGAAMARRALGKPEPDAKPKTQEERRAEWLASQEAERSTVVSPVEQRAAPAAYVGTLITTTREGKVHTYRADLHTPGQAYGIGSQRYAADGSLWTRAA